MREGPARIQPGDATPMPPPIDQRFAVALDYPVHFVHGLFDPANPLLADALDRAAEGRRHRVAAFVDAGLADARPGLLEAIRTYAAAHAERLELVHLATLPGGEAVKDGPAHALAVVAELARLGLDRQSFVLAVGGGALLDAVGFAAAIVHRGLRLVRAPSTTLAQADAGLGVKNGLNAHGQKNFLGTFAAPWAVLNDLELLDSLSDRDWRAGVAEAFKVAILKDAGFFNWLCGAGPALRGRDGAAMAHCVRRSAELHLQHIRTGGDPFEFGSARPLDFGHWAAHRLEGLTGYALGHGQAVAVGMSLDACYAAEADLCDAATRDALLAGLAGAGLPTWHEALDARDGAGRRVVLDGLAQFREHIGGRLTLTLPRRPGEAIEVHDVDPPRLERALALLRDRR